MIEPNEHVARFAGTPAFSVGASEALHDYQRVGYTWGPLLAVCLLLVVAALVAAAARCACASTPRCSPR